ncbi:MAG: histone H1 [Phycisphaerae bacterium]
MEEYDQLKKIIEEVDDDISKALGGNKAAGTRVRKAMQDVKNVAQEIRKRVLEIRSDDQPGS